MSITAAVKHLSPGRLGENGVYKAYAIINMNKVYWGIWLLNDFAITEETSGMTFWTNQTTEPDYGGLEVRGFSE